MLIMKKQFSSRGETKISILWNATCGATKTAKRRTKIVPLKIVDGASNAPNSNKQMKETLIF